MKLSAFAVAAGAALVTSASALAAPLTSVSQIGADTEIRVLSTARTGSIEGRRAAAIAGLDVNELRFVGLPTNAALEDELEDEGYEMGDLVKLYTDMNGVIWAYVHPEKEDKEEDEPDPIPG